MAISVRPVRLESEGAEVLEMLKTNLLAIPHVRRFKWLYHDNPDGPAWTWFVYERETNHVVGVASVFVRMMWVGCELMMGGQVGDFAVAANYRSLGPALLLQRATFEPVDQGKLALCYDCPPHATAMATFRRLGLEPSCSIERYTLPLRLDSHLRRYIGPAAYPVVGVANFALRTYRRMGSRDGDFDIVEHYGPFGEEFSQLDRSARNAASIRIQRGATQLNWRYQDDPLQKHCVLTARRKGELVAFVIFCEAGSTVRIEDLFGVDIASVGPTLLQAVVEGCAPSHERIEVYLSKGSPFTSAFMKAGFHRRPVAAQVVPYTREGSLTSEFVQHNPTWAFTGADVQA